MIGNAGREERKKFRIAKDQLLTEMITYGPDSPEYSEMLERMERVNKLQVTTIKSPLKGASPDTMLLVAGNLAGIALIVFMEERAVFASAAQKFILKAH